MPRYRLRFLAHANYPLNPDAVACAGTAYAVQTQARTPAALSIVIKGDLRDRLIGVAKAAAGP